jgi:hypothetical protein
MLSLQVQGSGEGTGCASDLQDGCEWCDSGTISKEEMKEAKHCFVCDCPEGLKRVHWFIHISRKLFGMKTNAA